MMSSGLIEFRRFRSYLEGIKELGSNAGDVRQNLMDRLALVCKPQHPLEERLFSKTFVLYGIPEDYSHTCFKIDHNFPTELLTGKIDQRSGLDELPQGVTYQESQGSEFVVLGFDHKTGSWQLPNLYGIRMDKYERMKEQVKAGLTVETVEQLVTAGGFRILGNEPLEEEEFVNHDGWLELAVGRNNATTADYERAKTLLSYYFRQCHEFTPSMGERYDPYLRLRFCVGQYGGPVAYNTVAHVVLKTFLDGSDAVDLNTWAANGAFIQRQPVGAVLPDAV